MDDKGYEEQRKYEKNHIIRRNWYNEILTKEGNPGKELMESTCCKPVSEEMYRIMINEAL